MNKKFIKLLSFCMFCIICFTSCERYPVSALLGIPKPIDSWPDPWYLYDDEINTKGSLAPKRWDDDPSCADWDKVKLDFACKYHPKNGRNCIQFIWLGNINDSDKGYFGFGLMARENPGGVINLETSGYSNLKFWIKGTLYNNCSFKMEIPRRGSNTPWVVREIKSYEISSSNWTEIVIPLPNVEDMEIEYDVAISLVSDGITNGGTVYLDDIRFTRD